MLDKKISQMYGQMCWGIEYGYWTNLSLSFGDPVLKVRERPRNSRFIDPQYSFSKIMRMVTVEGRWWLWVYLSYWSILDGNKIVASTSHITRKSLHNARLILEGQKLVYVNVCPDTGFTEFTFDLGGRLQIRRRNNRKKVEELWTLYKPSGYVLCVYSDGTFIHKRGSQF